jgi:hypothetical protein
MQNLLPYRPTAWEHIAPEARFTKRSHRSGVVEVVDKADGQRKVCANAAEADRWVAEQLRLRDFGPLQDL